MTSVEMIIRIILRIVREDQRWRRRVESQRLQGRLADGRAEIVADLIFRREAVETGSSSGERCRELEKNTSMSSIARGNVMIRQLQS